MLVFCLAYSSTLKVKVTGSTTTSGEFHQTTQHYTKEDIILHNHRCENLISHNFF
jgi:hypothetical protein